MGKTEETAYKKRPEKQTDKNSSDIRKKETSRKDIKKGVPLNSNLC
ncbi:hypothetical protein [uncultured Bacteroides sp.]|nr:hypothetical protein [uncultured Bacteroides sp.]